MKNSLRLKFIEKKVNELKEKEKDGSLEARFGRIFISEEQLKRILED